MLAEELKYTQPSTSRKKEHSKTFSTMPDENDSSQNTRTTSLATEGVRRARSTFIDEFAKRILKAGMEKAEQPLQELRNNLPTDPKDIRELPFYNSTLDAVKYKRDTYLVGQEYAIQRKTQREANFSSSALMLIPYDATALGSLQTIKLGSWFIPSPTIKDVLLPVVLNLPSGVLREPIMSATVNAIPLGQPQLNTAVKDSLLAFMENPYWRQVMKSRTNTYITYPEDE
jgi:hypothetical protein